MHYRILLFVIIILPPASLMAQPPDVVVSIRPLHALVGRVMQDVAEPVLLLEGNTSPHHVQLRPQQMQRLHAARLVVWAGPGVESFMPKILTGLPEQVQTMAMNDMEGVVRHPWRSTKGATQHPHSHHTAAGYWDAHVWLDPRNAIVLVQAVAEKLSALDAAHAAQYQSNAVQAVTELEALDHAIQRQLAVLTKRRYVAYHDALQYFERRYALEMVAMLTMEPELPLQVRQVQHVKRQMQEEDVTCLINEPGMQEERLRQLFDDPALRIAALDPLGRALPPGPSLYPALLQSLADGVQDCLQ